MKRPWVAATGGNVVSVGIFFFPLFFLFGICDLKKRGWKKEKARKGGRMMARGISKERTPSARLCPHLTDVCTSLWAATLWLKAGIQKEWHFTVRQASRPKWGKTIYLYKNLYMCIQSNTFKTIVLILILLQQKTTNCSTKLMLMA